jgi:REP element-mobilizing transposase RayT
MITFRRKNIRLKDFDYKNGYAYFVTICTSNKKTYFDNHDLAGFVESTLQFRINKNEIMLFCYCIMPNYIHLLLSLDEKYGNSLSGWISSFKRYISRIANEKYSIKNLWQRNYYDHVVRGNESLSNIAEYILNNPVRKGLAGKWTEYPFSKLTI